MPKVVTVPTMFQEGGPTVGRLKTDRHMLPHYNSSETLSLLPGELFLKPWGDQFWVCMSQDVILPGEVRSVLLNWNGVFPCNFSTDVRDGDELYWDPDEGELGAMVLQSGAGPTAFLAGIATFSVDPAGKPIFTRQQTADMPPIVADEDSTHVQVVSLGVAVDGPGS